MKQERRFFIFTFGCRTNQAETRLLAETLQKAGWQPGEPDKAKLVLINSCAVTAKAEKEVRQTIRKIKRENPHCWLVLTGCWREQPQESHLNLKKFSEINLCLSRAAQKKLPEILKKKLKNFVPSPSQVKSWRRPVYYQDKYGASAKALVKIQDGCQQFCSYCLVPYLRRQQQSRSAKTIINEIKKLVKLGIKEVILTGINLASFEFRGAEVKTQVKNDLVKLLNLILTRTKIKKISFGSINLAVLDEDFLALYQNPSWRLRLSHHFHIPLQSGCDQTLKRMRRGYQTQEFYQQLVQLKKKIPGFSFSTDIIVGFPGETKEEFQTSLNFLLKIKQLLGKNFTKVHLFRYSPRPKTLAAKREGKPGWEKISEAEKRARAGVVKRQFRVYN